MVTSNKATLINLFAQGDIPQGSDYANLINSQVNLAETAEQVMAGNLNTVKLVTPRVSAANMNLTGSFTVTNLSVGGVSANTMNVAQDVSAVSGTVYASAVRSPAGYFGNIPVIVSATGTTRATAAQVTAYITRGQGTTDGSATGFILPVPNRSWQQYFIYEGAVSANLYPAGSDYQINAITSGNPFPLAANTTYIVIHKSTSAYAVK